MVVANLTKKPPLSRRIGKRKYILKSVPAQLNRNMVVDNFLIGDAQVFWELVFFG